MILNKLRFYFCTYFKSGKNLFNYLLALFRLSQICLLRGHKHESFAKQFYNLHPSI
jgi:hypothetical protein